MKVVSTMTAAEEEEWVRWIQGKDGEAFFQRSKETRFGKKKQRKGA